MENKIKTIKGNTVITLDYDNIDKELEGLLASTVKLLKKQKRVMEMYSRVSSSGKGKHYKIFFCLPTFVLDNLGEQELKAFKWWLRYMLGDCFGRLKVDCFRIKENLKDEVLFVRKDGKEALEWTRIF